MHAKSLQSCLTLRDPMDSSPPGSSNHRILQARILEWVAISFSIKNVWQVQKQNQKSCVACTQGKWRKCESLECHASECGLCFHSQQKDSKDFFRTREMEKYVLLNSEMILQHWAEEILCSVTQSCPTLCNPMDCGLPGSSIHGDSPGNNTGVDCHDLLQRIFPIQGSNPHLLCLLHWQVDFLHWVRATQKAPGKQGEPVTNEGTSNRGMLETLQMWDWHNNKFDGVIFINLKHISDLYHNLSQWANVGRRLFSLAYRPHNVTLEMIIRVLWLIWLLT